MMPKVRYLSWYPEQLFIEKGCGIVPSTCSCFSRMEASSLQQRPSDKDICPGTWDLSVAEHLMPGEDYVDAAHRGLSEELSIKGVPLKPLGDELVWRFGDPDLNIKDNEFQQCFAGVTDKTARVDGVEVVSVRLISLGDLEVTMRESPDLFTPWIVGLADRVGLFTGGIHRNL